MVSHRCNHSFKGWRQRKWKFKVIFVAYASWFSVHHSPAWWAAPQSLLLWVLTVRSALLQPGLLGVFQKLIASKANDHQGFYLLNSIIEHMPPWVPLTLCALPHSVTSSYRTELIPVLLFDSLVSQLSSIGSRSSSSCSRDCKTPRPPSLSRVSTSFGKGWDTEFKTGCGQSSYQS